MKRTCCWEYKQQWR